MKLDEPKVCNLYISTQEANYLKFVLAKTNNILGRQIVILVELGIESHYQSRERWFEQVKLRYKCYQSIPKSEPVAENIFFSNLEVFTAAIIVEQLEKEKKIDSLDEHGCCMSLLVDSDGLFKAM